MVCVAQCSLYFNYMQQVCCARTSLCQPTPLLSTPGLSHTLLRYNCKDALDLSASVSRPVSIIFIREIPNCL